MPKDIIVIGGSSGGLEAVKTIVSTLTADFPAALFIVLHTSPDSPGVLGAILSRAGRLPAVTVMRRQRIEPGRIYVPPPDHHLLIEPGIVLTSRGPKENRFRPAIDPLFRSAAQTYGPRVIGVVLTGGLDDGTAGLWTVKRLGGTAVVQEPEDALVASMPRSALAHVAVDHCVPLAEIGPLLMRLVSEAAAPAPAPEEVPESVNIEVNVAKEENAIEAGVLKLGTPSNYACPECHGVLLEVKEGDRVRFRCHTGHAYSAASFVSEIDEAIEQSLWNAVRALEEKMLLLDHLASHGSAGERQDSADPGDLERLVEEARERTSLVRRALGIV